MSVLARTSTRSQQLLQRGLTTVEYAIGLLGAAAAALVLWRMFSDNKFFDMLFDWVVKLFTDAAEHNQ